MCGIAGVFGKADSATVDAMLTSFVHRGPDEGYCVVGPDFTLGARRLSIVDLEGGRQPLSNEDQSIWAAQNGEIYNFPAVKKQLLDGGHKFSTRCDTEVIPHLYQQFGTAFVNHIDGMFAISIWDTKNNLGVLARDRMGKKPLYYLQQGDKLYYASEIKALLQVPGFVRELDLQALEYYLSLKHVPCPLTIFKGIKSLPPAHFLTFRPGQDVKIERYWDLSYAPDNLDIGEDEAADKLLEILERGVKRRLMADVPIGFFLSGGIDSSLSTALAARLSDKPIKTFTLTYGDDSTTAGKQLDKYWADWIAREYKTEHYEECVHFGNFPDNIKRVIKCFDEPFAGTTSGFFLSGLIARHVKVALSGDGADELFGSYLSHRLAFPLSQKDGKASSPSDNALLSSLYEDDDWRWRSKLMVFRDDQKQLLFSDRVPQSIRKGNASALFEEAFNKCTATDPLNRVLEAEFKTIFADQVLTFVDRLSMAHSLEVRTAYLDTELVQFAASLPGRLKIKDGETKYVLKLAAKKILPPEMVDRPKEGFVMPVADWLRGDLASYVSATLSPERLRLHGLFSKTYVSNLVARLEQPGSDYHDANRILALIVFQEWYEMYMDVSNYLSGESGRTEVHHLVH